MNLPLEIISSILCKLSIRSIVACKCVCREWHDLISSSGFAMTHLSESTPALAVHQFDEKEDSFKLVEFEDFPQIHHPDRLYKLVRKFDPNEFITNPNSVPTIVLEGSVDGLLLLRDFATQPDSLYVCNPITRDCLPLPVPECFHGNRINSHFGFGRSQTRGEYKVCWNSQPQNSGSCPRIPNPVECLVYTLGMGSWRKIESPGGGLFHCLRSSVGVFLHGNLHWLVQDSMGFHLISCLDLDKEVFQPFCSPPPRPRICPESRSLAVLQGCLCLCEYSAYDSIVIWEMKQYRTDWRQQVVIKLPLPASYETLLYPVKVFEDGALLILWEDMELFFYNDGTKTSPAVDHFGKIHCNGWTEAMLHTCSFLSLKSFSNENVTSF